jgi:hypothetical protein
VCCGVAGCWAVVLRVGGSWQAAGPGVICSWEAWCIGTPEGAGRWLARALSAEPSNA